MHGVSRRGYIVPCEISFQSDMTSFDPEIVLVGYSPKCCKIMKIFTDMSLHFRNFCKKISSPNLLY